MPSASPPSLDPDATGADERPGAGQTRPRRTHLGNVAFLVGAVALAALLTVASPSPPSLQPRLVSAAPGPRGEAQRPPHDLSALRVFNYSIYKIRDAYVDPSRVDAKEMFIAALEGVERNIAEVLVDPRRAENTLVVQVNDKRQSFPMADVDSVWRLQSRLKEVLRFVQAHMNPSTDAAELEYAAVNGMLSTLDPHSLLLDPESAREMDVQVSGKFGGIGVVIGLRKNKTTQQNQLTVMSLVAGDTPARRAGIKPNDHIVRINDEPTMNLTTTEAMGRLRGDPRTPVNIQVEREGLAASTNYTLTRAEIRVSSVRARMLGGNVGYLRVEQFNSDVGADTRRAIEDLKAQGARAWILDLRRNPGGLLDQAVRLSDLFLDSGTVVTTVASGGKQRDERRAQSQSYDQRAPLAVLVSGSSASASEIVAGALKNLDRGMIIGETTFGKGSVQQIFDFEDDSKLKLTVAEYLTPGDVSIQSVGITPDIQLDPVLVPDALRDDKDQVRLLRPRHRYRESELEQHLTSKSVRKEEQPAETLRYLAEYRRPVDEDDEEEEELGVVDENGERFYEDLQIRLSREIVSAATSGRRSEALREVKGYLARKRAEEEQRISAALAKVGVDWSTGPKLPGARLAVTFASNKPGNKADAGAVVSITGTATNLGTAPAYQVRARAKTDDYMVDGTELIWGKIAPGETKTFTAQVKLHSDAESHVDLLEWETSELHGAPIEATPMKLAIEGLARPQFAYSYELVDAGAGADKASVGNGDGLVQKGESFKLLVNVRNTGKGDGRAVTATLRSSSGDRVIVNKGRFEMGKLAAAEARAVDFTFDVRPDFRDEEIVLEMTVFDNELREGVTEKLAFPVRAPVVVEAAQGVVRVAKKDLEVRSGARADAFPIGVAKKGAVLRQSGRAGEFVRVALEGNRQGFVPAAGVVAAPGTSVPATLGDVYAPLWQVTPPNLALVTPGLETSADRITLTGTATDDRHVEDVFVVVSNRDSKIDARKVFYDSNRGKKNERSLDFKVDVPVWPGNNVITVVARENDEVRATQTVYVLRAPASTIQAARP